MTKHHYTDEDAPMNTGSLTRPARFNMRLTCSARARTHKAFCMVREMTGMPRDSSYADVWEERVLPAIEHILWNAREAPRGTRQFVMDLFRPLATEDYVRARYERLRERLGRSEDSRKKGAPIQDDLWHDDVPKVGTVSAT